MSVETLFGRAAAEIAQGGYQDTVRETYQDALTQNGIVFPTVELEETIKLYDAHAAFARGSIALEADGSVVDLSDFDFEAAGETLRANKVPLDNRDKLHSLAELGLLSEAGTFLAARVAEQRGENDETAVYVRSHTGLLKQLVQISMATDEWAKPWNDVVAKRFEGPITTFPLDVDDYQRGLVLMDEPFFRGVRRRHFPGIGLYRFNLQNALINQEPQLSEAQEAQYGIAAQIGQFYAHSPEAAEQMIAACVDNGLLKKGVEWSLKIRDAVDVVRSRTARP